MEMLLESLDQVMEILSGFFIFCSALHPLFTVCTRGC